MTCGSAETYIVFAFLADTYGAEFFTAFCAFASLEFVEAFFLSSLLGATPPSQASFKLGVDGSSPMS